jgi:hypothetical protein
MPARANPYTSEGLLDPSRNGRERALKYEQN